jgi:hypothetical protein
MEQLLLIAIFLLVGLVNMLVRWLRRRAEASRPAGEAEPAPGPVPGRRRELPPAARVISPELPVEAAVAPARRMRPPASAPPPRRRPRAHRRLGSRADIRRAIVTMTVLGPCRAREREAEVETPASARP